MARQKPPQEDFVCPVCGAEVPAGSKSCPECGACEKSGWSGDDTLEEEDFDYEKFVAEEFGGGAPRTPTQRRWAIVALILFVALAILLFAGWWW